MASELKLKQSSLDSFLLPKPPTGNAAAASSTNPTTTTTSASTTTTTTTTSASTTTTTTTFSAALDYEGARQENIRRNREFLQKLGIPAGPLAPKPWPPPKHKPRTRHPLPSPPSPSTPLRRSTRKRPLPHPSSPSPTPSDGRHEADEALESPTPTYVESSVFQYTCDRAPTDPFILTSSPPSSSFSPISGFRVTGKTLREPSLAKIYAMDIHRVKDTKVLVAAGGHGGFISIFGGDVEEDEEGGDGTAERETQGPLMSWKGSRGWVSGVLFAEDNPMLLVSSSNDGGVVVWDLAKQPPLVSPLWSPPVVAESRELHSGGIFSMDQLDSLIATASKDSSIAITRLMMDGQLVVQRTISGHHSGVIRGVCFGETKDRLADCGADGCICVLDARLPEPCTLTIESKHRTGVNTVKWCPSNNSLLLSASKDPTLLLYDIRNSTEPVHELQGHVQSNTRTCNQIYKPTFVDNGLTIATPGQGSKKISMYSVDEGKLISQGMIEYDANLVFFAMEDTACPRLWTAGKQINQLCPLRLGASW